MPPIHALTPPPAPRANQTDADHGSNGVCRVSDGCRWLSPDAGVRPSNTPLDMRCMTRALTAIAIAFLLGSCASSRVPYGPSVSFECRLSIWPTFEPPVEYLIQRDSLGHSTITEFRFRGDGGYGSKRSGTPMVHPIDSKQWGNFIDAVRTHNPWAIPTQQPYRSGVDGTTMILEIRDGERHHRVQRWVPFAHKSEKSFVEFLTSIITLLPAR